MQYEGMSAVVFMNAILCKVKGMSTVLCKGHEVMSAIVCKSKVMSAIACMGNEGMGAIPRMGNDGKCATLCKGN